MLHLGLLNLILFWSLLLVSIALFSRHSILISLQPPPPAPPLALPLAYRTYAYLVRYLPFLTAV